MIATHAISWRSGVSPAVVSTTFTVPMTPVARSTRIGPNSRHDCDLWHCRGHGGSSTGSYIGSRATGQDMQRGPPRPVPNSDPAMVSTSIPASCRRVLVCTLRS
jgi:hypothetical protein